MHRQSKLDPRRCRIVDNIPVTDPVSTLVDLAALLPDGELSAAINEADHLDLVRRPKLRRELDSLLPRPGVGRLRALFARQELALPATVLEQRFLRIVQAAKLPLPESQASAHGHHAHLSAGLTTLRFSHEQIRYEPGYVRRTLAANLARLQGRAVRAA